MSEAEFEKVIAPVLNTVKDIPYDEAIIICNALGKLKTVVTNISNSASESRRVKRVTVRASRMNVAN